MRLLIHLKFRYSIFVTTLLINILPHLNIKINKKESRK